MTENERIRELRKHLGLTLAKMGEILKISDAAISMIEKGKSAVTDRTRSAIVREFGVSELWLRTGEGEMFPPRSNYDELTAFFADSLQEDDDFKRRFLLALSRMPPEGWTILRRMVEQIAQEQEEQTETKKEGQDT